MKILKKVAIFMMAICLLVPCFSMVSFAADGKIMFTDPSCKTGETVEVKGVVEKSSGTIGKIEITMTYDTAKLKFNSGNGITESESGVITYQGDATNDTGSRKEFVIKFDALQIGTAEIKIQSATIKDVRGTTKNYTKGSSKVTISQGETVVTPPTSSSEALVDVDGQDYKFADAVPENEIPEGYAAAVLNYDLVDYNVVYSEGTGLYLAYLINSENVGDLFMYIEEDATFIPYESIKISEETTIALLRDVTGIKLPVEYKETEVVINEHAFPAWQNADEPSFCIIYAMNGNGVKSLYQMDSEEGTYQRFYAPDVVEEQKETWLTKLSEVLNKHLDTVILVTGLGFLLFILIIVILSIKLYNRNMELDEIYEEYGLGDEEDKAVSKEKEDDDEDDDDASYYERTQALDEEETDPEMEMLVQEGMKEVFPEEELQESMQDVIEVQAEEEVQVEETSLAQALEQQKEAELFDDDEILLEDFAVDFIDLEDE
jgi:hypothetical protein